MLQLYYKLCQRIWNITTAIELLNHHDEHVQTGWAELLACYTPLRQVIAAWSQDVYLPIEPLDVNTSMLSILTPHELS